MERRHGQTRVDSVSMSLLFRSLIVLCICTGCSGYHLERDAPLLTLSVPYVTGDVDGCLTTSLIQKIERTSGLSYSCFAPSTVLTVCLQGVSEDNIGFRYAPSVESTGGSSRILAAEEARLTAVATCTLIDCASGETLFGPQEIAAYITFDFEPDFSNIDFHEDSLGQLERYPLAKDAALVPLYDKLAQKIVDYILLMH